MNFYPLAALLLVLATGCIAPRKTLSTTVVYIPHNKGPFHTQTEWEPCLVLRTNPVRADTVMQLKVGGEVQHPGTIEVPKGTTALEAIAKAGGFTPCSRLKTIVLLEGGKKYSLHTHRQKKPFSKPRIWYGGVSSDRVLEPGAWIFVPRT